MPNCSEEFQAKHIDFTHLGRRVVEGRFDGGSMTSDAGVMLLGTTDRKLGLMNAAARCIADTLRIKLLKLAAVVTRNTRRIWLYLASKWPSANIFATAMRQWRSP